MELIRTIHTTTDTPFIYVSMDTTEGEGCVGHWIWECALFLPYIKDIQKKTTKPLKILLNAKKQYKLNILSDFGFYDNDIEYSTNMAKDGDTYQEYYVVPMKSEYSIYVPKFFYLWNTTIHTSEFFDALQLFREFYINSLPLITKTIPFVYVTRSKKENYIYNSRNFVNIDDFYSMLNKNNVDVLDIDDLTSLTPQFEKILKAHTIILEMGSVFTINAAFIASNSHIIIINDGFQFDYYRCSNPFFLIFKKLMYERNNTIETHKNACINTSNGFSIHIKTFEDSIKSLKLLRTVCIVCNNSDFETINSFPKFPIMAISNNSVSETYYDYNLIVCNKCKCLQLKHLVDPTILYSDIYMNATFSPSWNEHHIAFSNFILTNTHETIFLEVGANKGDLYKIMIKEKPIEFVTLDMYKHKDLPSEIKFIEGNCETFDFKGFNTIILSHVFEHLYSPLSFIKNIRNAGVSNVFISIPDFDLLIKDMSLLTINSQHTFYCGFDYIIYMFSLYNYKCETSFIWSGNCKSSMFKFVLDIDTLPNEIPSTDIQLYKNIYLEKVNKIHNMEIPINSYIMPSGIYGQLYYYLIKDKHHIIGFLDNNSQRHGNNLYGTDKIVYSPSTIDYNIVTVIICDSVNILYV
jgi:hypothetical protein